MRKAIVTTTINSPTKALKRFIKIADKQDWHLFIVGDKKTPHQPYYDIDTAMDCVTYLDPEAQEKISPELSELIGWNCIQRRNFGLVAAYKWGAGVIATVDDDNIPYDNWGRNCKVGKVADVNIYTTETVFDPLSPIFPHLWHRGFPIQELDNRKLKGPVLGKRTVLVQADFWDGAPDVDAVCRITLNPQVQFTPGMIPIGSNVIAPFNSQNTFLSRQVIPDYFLFPGIGRMDDIWAAYYVQDKHPDSVIFAAASVVQDRNEHDLTTDLEAEMLGYRHNHEIVKNPVGRIMELLPANAVIAFKVYQSLINKASNSDKGS